MVGPVAYPARMLDALKWDATGLVSVVAQDRHTGEVRMLAHANREAVLQTLETGYAHFFSRSRQQLWKCPVWKAICRGRRSHVLPPFRRRRSR